MSVDLEKRIKELEPEELLRMMKALEREMKNRIDRGEIVKPDSGDLVKDVLEAIEKYVTHYYKPSLKAHQGVPLQGFSGNWWMPDVMIEDIEIEDEADRVKAIIECKEIGEGTSYQTYRYAHVPRAYTELADLRN